MTAVLTAALALRLLVLSSALGVAGCATAPRPGAAPPVPKPSACSHGQPMTRTYLFFGQKTAAGGAIAPARWRRFLRGEVARAFPQGFTVIDARGFWQAKQGHTLWEGAKVVIRLHQGRPADHAGIERLRRRYKAQFQQQSILRVDERVCASF